MRIWFGVRCNYKGGNYTKDSELLSTSYKLRVSSRNGVQPGTQVMQAFQNLVTTLTEKVIEIPDAKFEQITNFETGIPGGGGGGSYQEIATFTIPNCSDAIHLQKAINGKLFNAIATRYPDENQAECAKMLQEAIDSISPSHGPTCKP